MIRLSSAFVLALLVAGVTYLLGHLVFLNRRGGMVVGAIIERDCRNGGAPIGRTKIVVTPEAELVLWPRARPQ